MTAQADAIATGLHLSGSAVNETEPEGVFQTVAVTPAPTISPFIPPDESFTPNPEPHQAAIRILAPGPLSKVSSPIRLRAYVIPSKFGRTRVELIGEDGRLLHSDVVRLTSLSSEGAYMSIKIPFEIAAAVEFVRLQISTEDESGRTQALGSVHLLLLSVGNEEINPPGNLLERCVLFDPLPEASISDGMLVVSGEMQPFNTQPLSIKLIDQSGKTLGLRELALASDERQAFTTTVPYKVNVSTSARVTISQADDRIPGLMYLYSQEITLNP